MLTARFEQPLFLLYCTGESLRAPCLCLPSLWMSMVERDLPVLEEVEDEMAYVSPSSLLEPWEDSGTTRSVVTSDSFEMYEQEKSSVSRGPSNLRNVPGILLLTEPPLFLPFMPSARLDV